MKNKLLLISCFLLVLQGCTSNSSKVVEKPVEPATYIAGEFNQESLYDLLLAEIAGQRRQFPIAFENYLTQAKKTRDPAVAERATRIAQYLRDAEKIRSAASVWKEVDTENPEPYQIEASILLHQNKYEEALPLIEKALGYNDARTLALIRSQSNNISDQVITALIQMLNEHAETNKPNADLELTLALLYRAQGKLNDALRAFDSTLLLNPKNIEAVMRKAELLREMDRLYEATELVQSAFEHNPDDRQLHLLYSQLLFQTEKHVSATEQAEALIANHPNDHQLAYYLALLMLENEQLDSAEKILKSLFTLKPEDSSPNYYLGHIEQARGNINKAVEHYSRVRHGGNVLQSISRATGLLNRPEDKNKVQLILKDARASVPSQAPRLFALETEWLNLHNYEEEALTVLEDALAIHTDNTTLLYSRAMLIEDSDFSKAEQDFKRILEREPDNATVKNALGYTLLLHTDRYEEAYDLIKSALDKEPDDPAILDSMGWALFKLERYQEAIPYLEKAHAMFADPEVSSHLIQTYWATGQEEKARELLEKSKKTNPENPYLQEAEQAIRPH
ncbi:MAG: tetratricopeptide repeat protein [Neptuniibacter sp.]